MHIFTRLFTVVFLFGTVQVMAQQGPGGIEPADGTGSLVLWLRSDSLQGLNNGDPVSLWADQSGYGHDATQGTLANQPSYIASALNGLPAVQLDGVNDYFDDAHTYQARTVFIVYNFINSLQGADDLGQLWGAYGDNVHVAIDSRATNLNGLSFDGGNQNGTSARYGFDGAVYGSLVSNDNSDPVTRDTYQLVTAEFDANRTLNRQVIGALIPNFTLAEHNYGGQILEIIVYDRTLSSVERIAVENYIASKYNQTIANDAYAFEGTHAYDLSGVGQANGEQNTTAKSSEVLAISTGAGLDADGEYLFFAHQNGGLNWTTTEAPAGGANLERIGREWRIDETGELGTVTVTLDTSLLDPRSNGYTKFALLVDGNGDFSEGATVYELVSPGADDQYEVDIDLADGQYLSIAAVRPVLGFVTNPLNEFESTDPGITITLNYVINPDQPNVTVDYETQGTGSATGATAPLNSGAADEDYEIIGTTTATIVAGTQSTSFTLNINQDTQLEGDESLNLVLSNGPAGINLDAPTLVFTINDDDNPRKIYFETATSTVAETTSSLDITVSLTPQFVDFSNPTTANYAVTGGNATGGGVDYTLASGTVTIPAGSVSEVITVTFSDDALKETNETIQISLSSPTNSGLSGTNPIVHTVTITDNEADPTVQFNVAASSGTEGDTPTISVVLSEVAGTNILVDYVLSGTATGGGVDYTLAAGTFTVSSGSLSANFTPAITSDALPEADETLVITLSNPQNATLGTRTVHTYTILDDDGSYGFSGPGGVGNSTVNSLWLRADAISQSDGTAVTAWNDASGNGADVSQAAGANQPTFETGEINGQPVVRFDGTNDYLNNASVSYNAQTVFTVVRPNAPFASGDFGQVWGDYNDGAHLALDNRAGNTNGFSFDGGAATQARYALNGSVYSGLVANDNATPWTNSVTQLVAAEFSGVQALTQQNVGSTFPGHPVGSFHYGGDIGEIIVYNTTLGLARRNLVENYLAAKWGLSIPNDFYAYEGTHGQAVAGIGRESDGDHTEAQSAGVLRVANPSALENGDYLLFGHDGAALTWSATETPADSLQRIAREWRVDETNEVGTLTVAIDASALPALPTDHEGYLLMVDPDGDFSNGGTTLYPLTLNGGEYEVTGLNLSDGDYLSVATTGITVFFAVSTESGSENTTSVSVTVRLSRASVANDIDVSYLVNGASTATGGGTDYSLAASPLTISQGNTSNTFSITVVDDTDLESDETIVIDITGATNAAVGSTNQYTYTILDEDAAELGTSGPAGVRSASNYAFWLRSDRGTLNGAATAATNGQALATWQDQSGNGNDGIEETDYAPGFIFNLPEFANNATDNINGRPVIKFDGANTEGLTIEDDALVNTGGGSYAAKTVMAVFETGSDVTTRQVIWDQGSTGNGAIMYIEGGAVYVGAWSGTEGWDGDYRVSGSVSANQTYVVTLEFDGSNTALNGYVNAVDQGSVNTTSGLLGQHGGDNGIGAQINGGQYGAVNDSDDGAHYFTGNIMEVLSINAALGTAERLLVENYLAAKYNVTLVSNNLFAYNTTHSYDVAGIGRSAANEANVATRSTDLLVLSNASSLGIGDYLMVGHDNADASTWVTTDRPDANIERIAREWRITETNEVGTVRFTFDPAEVAGSPSAAFTGRALLLDDDGNFTSGATLVPMTLSGGVYVADVDVTNGQFLTVAAVRPVVSFAAATANAAEDAGTITVTARLNVPLTSPASVDFALNSGSSTATEGAGNDFTLTDGTLNFPAGALEATFTFDLLTDGMVESTETVVVDLSSPSAGLNLGSVSTFTFSIIDIDNSQEIDFAVEASATTESAVTHNVTIRLNAVNGSQPTTVDYAVTGGTATGGGTDFTLVNGTATIPSGQLTTTITISLVEDAFNEVDETIVISLSDAGNARLGANTVHTVTLQDNDDDPTVAFNATTGNGSESTTTVNIPVSLSAASGETVTVDYAVTSSTATDGIDFGLMAGTLSFAPGSAEEDIVLTVADDGAQEVDETITITLSAPTSATLGANTTFTYTINDNDDEAATGPGGIRDSADYAFWLRVDREVLSDSLSPTAATDGDAIQRWDDQSSFDRDAIGITGNEPLFGDNLSDNINGRPVIDFSGGDYEMDIRDDDAINTGAGYPLKTIAIAFQTGSDVSNQQTVYEQGGSSNGLSVTVYNDSLFLGAWSENNGWNFEAVGTPISSGQNVVAILEFSSLDGELRGRVNGVALTPVTGIPDEISTHGGDISIGYASDTDFRESDGGGFYFTGKVSEILSLNSVLTTTEAQILENYLSARFLAGLGAADYFAYKTTHSHDVSGIGRVSATDFKATTQVGKLIAFSNASSLDDGDFIIVGHDNGAVADYVTTESPSADLERLSREWRVGLNGDPGTLTVTYDPTSLSTAVPSFGFNEYVVLVDADGDFTTGATAYPMTKNGAIYQASGVDFSEGDYFTIGVFRPRVAFAQATSNVGEGVGSASVSIRLNYPLATSFTVTASQTGGTATENTDYTFADGVVNFPARTTSQTVNVSVLEDFAVETDETVVLSLTSPSKGNVGTLATHTLSINDNDNFRRANFVKTDSANSEDQSPIEIPVVLNARDLANPTEVYFTVSGGTATNDSTDYFLAVVDTLTYLPGDTVEVIALNIIDDLFDETDETVEITLTGGNNTTLGTSTTFTYTIQDNDVAPTVQFATASLSGAESFQTVDLPLTLSAASGQSISLNYSVTGGSATGGGADFSVSGSTLTIPAGSTEANIRITVIDDGTEEGVETIQLTLSGPVNAVLGGNDVLTYSILDNDGLGSLGPGGVGNLTSQVKMWLRSTDAPGNTDGGGVETWTDQSSNGNNAFQTVPGEQPVFLENSWNGRPVLAFDGANDVLDVTDTEDINTGGPYDRKTILVAFRTSTDVSTRQMLYEEGGGVRGLSIYIYQDSLYVGGWNNNDDDGGQTTPWPVPGPPTNYTNFLTRKIEPNSNNFVMLQFDFDVDGSDFNGDVRGSLNGEDLSEITGAGRLFRHPGNIAIGAVRDGTVFHDGVGGSNASYYTGNIAEVIVNNVVYNETQRRLVSNYLGAKFNVPIPYDYYTHQVGHSYEVMGIGQLDIQDFHNESRGSGVLLLNNPSDLQDDEFLLVGHNGEVLDDWETTEVPNNDTDNFIRLDREWRADETGGDVGTVSMFLDTDELPAPPFGFPINYVLLVDDDGDFTSGATIYQMTDAGSGEYEVNDIDLSNDVYFTFAMARRIVEFAELTGGDFEPNTSQDIEVTLNYIPATAVTVDYAVTAGTAVGSGTDYTLADGTLTIPAGSQSANINLTLVNDTEVEVDETLEITLSNPSVGIIGDNDVHTFTINDDDNPRRIQFASTSGSGDESVTMVAIPVELNLVDAANSTTVNYSVTSGTASGSGVDYTLAAGTANILPNESTVDINLAVIDDAIFEPSETLVITLAGPTNANLGANTTFTYTITDDDTQPTVEFTTAARTGLEAITSVDVEVSLSAPSGQNVTVDYSIDGSTTATNAGIDFDLQTTQLVIPAGSTTGNISFTVFNDAVIEGDELVVINLDAATNATLGTEDQHTYTISDDDGGFGIYGPGGVGGSPEMVFFLQGGYNLFSDAGITPATNGGSVAQWSDPRMDGLLATNSTLVTNSQPTYRDGTSPQAVNGQPVVEFNGIDDVLTVADDDDVNSDADGYTLKSTLVAFETGADVTSRQVIYEQGGGGNGFNIWLESGTLHLGAWSSWNYIESTTAIAANTAYYVVHELDQGAGVLRSYVNGTMTEISGMTDVLARHSGDVGIGAMNNDSRFSTSDNGADEDYFFNGKIMELAHYNQRNLNDAQVAIIASYMQAKYGITVSGSNYAYGSTYGNEVIGIGAAASGERHVSAKGTGLLSIDVPTALDNGDFLYMGNDAGGISSWTTTNAPNNPYIQRVERTWQVDKVNDLGTIRLGFDTTRLPVKPAGFDSFYLMVDNDADGDFTDVADGDFTFLRLRDRFGPLARISNVDFTDGDVFTIVLAQNVAVNDGDFSDAATWLIEVPEPGDPVVISSNVTLTGDTEISDITIDGGSLDIGAHTLTINQGTLDIVSGSVNTGTGTVEYASTSGTVCVEALTYYNLLISGSGTKQLCGDILVTQDVQINGNPTLDANGFNIELRGDWNSAVSATFTPQANQVTFSGGAAQQISKTGGGTEVFNNLIVNKSANNVTINEGNVRVNNTLTMTQGDFVLGTHNLIINNTSGSAIQGGGATSYIQNGGTGYLQHRVALGNTYALPIGDTDEYAPITFTLNTGTLGTASIRVTQTDAAHPARDNATIYLSRYWTILPVAIGGVIDYDLTFTYQEADVVGDETMFRMAKYSGGVWTNSEGTETLDTGTNTLTWTGITSFSDYTAFGDGTPLPVVWETFAARKELDQVVLDWTTAQEVDNDYFTVERSVDAVTWEALARVDAKGTSEASVDYRWVDERPHGMTSYYRIRQTDYDGQQSYSPVRTVYIEQTELSLVAYPNPVPEGGHFHIKLVGATADAGVTVRVLDLAGKQQFVAAYQTDARGELNAALTLPGHGAAGAYFLLLQVDGQVYRQKLIRQ